MNRERRFKGLFGFVVAHPTAILLVALLASLFSVLYSVRNMEFLTGRDDLMPQNTPYRQNYRNWRQEFGDMDSIAVVIESDDSERATRFGTALYEKLAADKAHFQDVFYPYGLEFFRKNALLFMPTADVRALRENLTTLKPLLKELSASPSVQTLFTYLTREIDGYVTKGGTETELGNLTFTLEKLGLGFKSFGNDKAPPPSFEEFFFQGKSGEESGFAKAGKMQVITALPVKKDEGFIPAEEAIKVIRQHLEELHKQPEYKGVTAGLTGGPVLENEEMSTSQHDIALATVVSLLLTVVLLLIAFRGVLNVIAAMVSLVVAICLSFGFATLTVGHLNIL